MSFVHLHVHSVLSVMDGMAWVEHLVGRARDLGMESLALTDRDTLAGVPRFCFEARRTGVRAIVGSELRVDAKEAPAGTADRPRPLVLLARDREGWSNLVRLATAACAGGTRDAPGVGRDLLRECGGSLVALAGGPRCSVAAKLASAGLEEAREEAARLRDLFDAGAFFLEVVPPDAAGPGQARLNEALRSIGRDLGIPLVAANDVRHLDPEDAPAHEVLRCAARGITLGERQASGAPRIAGRWLRPAEAMCAALPGFEDAVEASQRVAELCGRAFELLPDGMAPSRKGDGDDEELSRLAREGLAGRLPGGSSIAQGIDGGAYHARLEHELRVVRDQGLSGRMLDFAGHVRLAREAGVPLGPGRGTAAGSLLCFALGLGDVDPVAHGLHFERFLNPLRAPEVWVELEVGARGRGEVVRRLADCHGPDRVFQAAFHRRLGRKAIPLVGRAVGAREKDIERLLSLLEPWEEASRIEKDDGDLAVAVDSVSGGREILETAAAVERAVCEVVAHRATVFMADRPATGFYPLYGDLPGGVPGVAVAQLDACAICVPGLVTNELSPRKDLDLIDDCVARVRERKRPGFDARSIPLDDQEAFALLSRGDTADVIEMEEPGFSEYLERLRPARFDHLVAAISFWRPSPRERGVPEAYERRRHGREPADGGPLGFSRHLDETYGLLLYQEQAALILVELGLAADLAEADVVRRQVGRRKIGPLQKIERAFVGACGSRGLTAAAARDAWSDFLDRFGGTFLKAHACARATHYLRAAFLKAHFPIDFAAAREAGREKHREEVLLEKPVR